MAQFLISLLCCFAFLISPPLSKKETKVERTPESIGREIFEAIQNKDFARMESMMPTEAAVGKMLEESKKESESAPSTATPASVLAKMKQKMQEELDDILKSAKKHRVKLAKLQYGGILQNDENPESLLTMRAVVMEMRWQDKPVDIAYSVLQYEEEWYYTGILISNDVFSQLVG